MIATDQPTHLPPSVVVRFSSKDDGPMVDKRVDIHDQTVIEHRDHFCQQNSIAYADVVYQKIAYDEKQTYDTITRVGRADTTRFVQCRSGDVLITTERGVGLFLPVADCIATVVYDPHRHIIALMHLGRHATLTNVVAQTVAELRLLGSVPTDVHIWMSPHASERSYDLSWFDKADDPLWRPYMTVREGRYFLDLAGFNTAQFEAAGVPRSAITVSPVDTVSNEHYFSHRRGDHQYRMAALVYMT